jgi:hypothetical protein
MDSNWISKQRPKSLRLILIQFLEFVADSLADGGGTSYGSLAQIVA